VFSGTRINIRIARVVVITVIGDVVVVALTTGTRIITLTMAIPTAVKWESFGNALKTWDPPPQETHGSHMRERLALVDNMFPDMAKPWIGQVGALAVLSAPAQACGPRLKPRQTHPFLIGCAFPPGRKTTVVSHLSRHSYVCLPRRSANVR